MGKWTGVVTNAGSKLFEDWVNGTVLHLDNAAAGTGTVPDVGMLAQTKLVSQKQVVNILSGETIPEGRKLKVQITAPQVGYTLNQIGLWGHIDDNAPVMFALFQNSEGVAIPSFADSPDFAYTFYSTLAVSNQGELEIHINPDVLATIGYVDDAISAHNMDTEAHPDIRKLVGTGVDAHNEDAAAHKDIRKKISDIITSKGQSDGIASLDSSGKVPANQLPDIDVSSAINTHNTSNTAHSDIRTAIDKYKPRFFPVTIPATNAGTVGSVAGTFPACTADETTCIVDAAPTDASQDTFHDCGFWLKTISPTGFTYTVDSNLTAAMPICIMVQEV